MNVRFTQAVATAGAGYPQGSIHPIPDAQANQWIKSGLCEKTTLKSTAKQSESGLTDQDRQLIKDRATADKRRGKRETVRLAAVRKARAAKKAVR